MEISYIEILLKLGLDEGSRKYILAKNSELDNLGVFSHL